MKNEMLTPQGLFKNTNDDFDLTDLVMSIIKTDAVKNYTQIEDWIMDININNMTAQQIADEWDSLPAMETDNS
jgi:hypothetical protein